MENARTPRKRKIDSLQARVELLERQLAEARSALRTLAAPWNEPNPANPPGTEQTRRPSLNSLELPISNGERFRQVLQAAPNPLMIWRDDGQVLMVNIAWMEITGYALQDLPDLDGWLRRAVYPANPQPGRPPVRVKPGRESAAVVKWEAAEITTRSGEKRTWELSTASLGVDGQGRQLILVMAVDVTFSKQTAQALEASEARVQGLADTAFEGIWMLDASGKTTFVNQRMAELLRYASTDKLMRHSVFDYVFPADLEEFKRKLRLSLSKQGPEHYAARLECRDGSIRRVTVAARNLLDKRGRLLGRLLLFLDVEEGKRAERGLPRDAEVSPALPEEVPPARPNWFLRMFFGRHWKSSLPG